LFAQQLQHRMRRPVGRVRHVVGGGAGEAVVRVEARDLQHAGRAERLERGIGDVEKIVVVAEVGQHERVDQQRRLERRDRRLDQRARRVAEGIEQRLGSVAAHPTNRLRSRAARHARTGTG
jgi:hypothetical protein